MLGHTFKTAVANGADTSKLRPSNWGRTGQDLSTDPTHEFTGGAMGSLLYRDTGASDGSTWLAAAQGVLASAGAGQAPAYTMTPSLTSLTLATALTPGNGGTGLASYAVGDLLYASGAAALSKLADVATGSVLVSGGVGVAPAWSATPTLTSATLTALAALTTAAESRVGPSNTAGVYFKSGRLGFGTADPLALLHVQGAQGADATLMLGQTNLNRWHFTSPASSTALRIGDVGATEKITILSSGPIGFGTTTPVALLHIGPNPNTVASADPAVLVSRDVSDATGVGSAHGFVDFPTITRAGTGTGYACFDARQLYSGSSDYDHTVSLQSLPVFGSSGTLTHAYGVFHSLVVNAGTVTNSYGVRLQDASGAGAVTNNYGLYINSLTKGSSVNYAIYAAGGQTYLNGNVGVGVTGFGTSAAKVLGLGNGTEPGSSPADMVQLYSVDLSAGNATLGIRTETAVATESVTSDRTLSVRINGTTYKLCLKA